MQGLQFLIGANVNVIWSGGTVTLVNPHFMEGGNSVNYAAGGYKSITGGTLQIGDGVSGLSGGRSGGSEGYSITLSAPIWNLVINNRTDLTPSRICRLSISVQHFVYNDVMVNSNSYLRLNFGTYVCLEI